MNKFIKIILAIFFAILGWNIVLSNTDLGPRIHLGRENCNSRGLLCSGLRMSKRNLGSVLG